MNSYVRNLAFVCVCPVMVSTAAADTDFAACYGEALDVLVQVYEPTPDTNGEVVMNLPNPNSWSLTGRDGAGSLRGAGCLPEPVPVSRFNASGMQNKFQAALGSASGDLQNVRSLALSGGSKKASSESFYEEYQKKRDWYPVGGGFHRAFSPDDGLYESYGGRSFVAGVFRFPDEYLSPLGFPIVTNCSGFGFCKINYRISERLRINYEFRSSLEFQEKWIAQDQAIRALIAGFHGNSATDD